MDISSAKPLFQTLFGIQMVSETMFPAFKKAGCGTRYTDALTKFMGRCLSGESIPRHAVTDGVLLVSSVLATLNYMIGHDQWPTLMAESYHDPRRLASHPSAQKCAQAPQHTPFGQD